jgi:hypothetical protein
MAEFFIVPTSPQEEGGGLLMRASLGLIMRLVAANALAFAVLDCFAIGLRLLGRRARAERCWTVVGRGKKKRTADKTKRSSHE